jgi:hypothetical protein
MRSKILFFLALAFIFNACKKESNVTSPSIAELIPLAIGNYWIYNGVTLDVNGNETTTTWRDSSVVSGIRTVAGKQAYEISEYVNSSLSGLWYVSKDGEKYYIYFPSVSLFDSLSGRWLLWVDPASQSWTLFNQQVKFVIDSANNITASGTLNITSNKGAGENLTIKNQTVQAQQYYWDVNFNGKIDQIPGSTFTISEKIRWYFTPGIGLVKNQLDPPTFRIVVPLVMDTTFKGNGSKITLVDYKLNPSQTAKFAQTFKSEEQINSQFLFRRFMIQIPLDRIRR